MKRETELTLPIDPISSTSKEFENARDYVEYQIEWLSNFSNMVDAYFFNLEGDEVEIRSNKIYLETLDNAWLTRDQSKPCRWKPLAGTREAATTARYLKEAVSVMKGLVGKTTNDHWLMIEVAFRAGGHFKMSDVLGNLKVGSSGELKIIAEHGSSFKNQWGRKDGSGNKPKDWELSLKRELEILHSETPSMKPDDIFNALRVIEYIEFSKGKYRFKNSENWCLKKSIKDKVRGYWVVL